MLIPDAPLYPHHTTWAEKRKLSVLRMIDPSTPNIYHWIGDRGFCPNGATLVPDKFWFVPSLTAPSDYHDWQYHFGVVPRHDADITYRKSIRALARLMPKPIAKLPILRYWSRSFWAIQTRKLRLVADVYYRGVRALGRSSYDPLGLRPKEWGT